MTPLFPVVSAAAGVAAALLLLRRLLAHLGRPSPCTAPHAVAAGWLVALGTQGVAPFSWPPDPLAALGLGVLLSVFGANATCGTRTAGLSLRSLLATLPPLFGASSLAMALGRIEPPLALSATLVAACASLGAAALGRTAERLAPPARAMLAASWLAAVATAALTHGSLRIAALSLGSATASVVVAAASALRLAPASGLATVAASAAGAGIWAAWRLASLPLWLALALLAVPLGTALLLAHLSRTPSARRALLAPLPALLVLLLALYSGFAPQGSSGYGYAFDPSAPTDGP